jgi:glycosyltransferase involved in cell wall biosynthesis
MAIGKIYVCLLTHNRLQKLRHLIDNPHFWHGFDRLFILSQASEDGTDEWLRKYQQGNRDKPLTVWTSWQNRMAIGGRQRMIDRMIGYGLQANDVVVMLDDDMMPISPYWCDRLVSPLHMPMVGAAGVEGFNVHFDKRGLFMPSPPGQVDVCNGGWTAYRGAVFLDGMEIDQDYYPFWHADSDMCMQILAQGRKVMKVGRVGLAHAAHHRAITPLWEERRDMFIGKWRGKGLTKREKEAAQKKLDRKHVPPSKVVSLYAPTYDPNSGYGRMALELVRRFAGRGIQANAMGLHYTPIHFPGHDADTRHLLSRPIVPTVGGIVMGYPTLHEHFGPLANAGPKVAVTMFESSELPDGWVEALNQCQAVIVPTPHQENIFRDNGVTAPLHVLPLGVSDHFFAGQQRPMFEHSEARPYTFLALGDRGDRKGWKEALQAFHIAFQGRKDVRLILKARRGGGPPFNIDVPGVVLMRRDLSDIELRRLYESVDCMVYPAYGEGFGLPPREFAASAGPAIVNEWWADDVRKWGYPVGYTMTKAWEGHDKHEGLGTWAVPNVPDLVKLMKHMVEGERKYQIYMGWRSSVHVRRLYSWEKFAAGVWKIYQQVLEESKEKVKSA